MEITARSPRRFPSHQPCRSQAGNGPERTLQPEDYPLVEIVRDDLLNGHWLYLHPSKDGAIHPPRFHHHGPVEPVCAEMLSSFLIRSTPPVVTPPATTAAVYTAADHLER